MAAKSAFITFLLALCYYSASAEVTLAALFTDNMILQRDKPNQIWGWADANEEVAISFNGKIYRTFPWSKSGKWSVFIDPLPAGGPYEMVVRGTNQVTVKNILMGDIWLCSGQSNMEWKMGWLGESAKAAIQNSANPNIRLIEINKEIAFQPAKDVTLAYPWTLASAENTGNFSAIAYYFALELYQKYQVPIGLISSNWGGTVAQAWTSYEGLSPYPHYTEVARGLRWKTREQVESEEKSWQDKWTAIVRQKDKLNATWLQPVFDDSQWQKMKVPGLWEDLGWKDLDGTVVYRCSFDISRENLVDGKLVLGAIDDIDSTFINGKFVGSLNVWNSPRVYNLQKGLLKEGKNVIAIKIYDTGGGGGFHGEEKNLRLELANGENIPLTGEWSAAISLKASDFDKRPESNSSPNNPGVLYNAMIAPIVDYNIKGAIWYQGESNSGIAYEYRHLLPDMINDWRRRWGYDFPFLIVQLANFKVAAVQPEDSDWAELREAQQMTAQNLPSTGIACTIDIGDADNIHPVNKKDVGFRLALNAMKLAYAEKDLVYSGPTYKSMEVIGSKIRLHFDHIGTGLMTKNGELKQFAIAGSDKKFVWAHAEIEGNDIVVWSSKVPTPVAVRYAWANNPDGCNLYNKEGLPALPFRTDSWKGITQW
jgi:sialate O-acetylesterase